MYRRMNRKEHHRSRNQRGFNMIELMTAMTIGAIVLSVGIPTFTQVTQNNRLVTPLRSASV